MKTRQCEQISEWLESSPSGESIPHEFIAHSENCPECSALIKKLNLVKSGFRAQKLDIKDQTAIKKNVMDRILNSKPVPTVSDSTNRFSWLKLTLYLSAVIACLIYYSSVSHEKPDLSSHDTRLNLPVVSGNRGKLILASGKEFPLESEKRQADAKSSLVFGPDATASIHLPSSGIINIRGSGEIVLADNGFSCSNGNFTAKFLRKDKEFKIFVPQVILGIRGTEIAFELKDGKGKLHLLEGIVDVAVEENPQIKISWCPGFDLEISKAGIDVKKPAENTPPPTIFIQPPSSASNSSKIVPLLDPYSIETPHDKTASVTEIQAVSSFSEVNLIPDVNAPEETLASSSNEQNKTEIPGKDPKFQHRFEKNLSRPIIQGN
ncbi:MAG: hypothetical protein HQM10_18975 [Candidatus Riflebacteria bacterium]|nr:hypothetical protein [Candidatus Riflebacteria bacterium]